MVSCNHTRMVLFEKSIVKIKIINSSDGWWYQNYVNIIFEVRNPLEEEMHYYSILKQNRYVLITNNEEHLDKVIKFTDCKLLSGNI